jgi:hypothetical protein
MALRIECVAWPPERAVRLADIQGLVTVAREQMRQRRTRPAAALLSMAAARLGRLLTETRTEQAEVADMLQALAQAD